MDNDRWHRLERLDLVFSVDFHSSEAVFKITTNGIIVYEAGKYTFYPAIQVKSVGIGEDIGFSEHGGQK